MSGIFLSDKANVKRSLNVINRVLVKILPRNLVITHSVDTRTGFKLSFPNEQDANTFFNDAIYHNLQRNDLQPHLDFATQKQRAVIIPNVPLETYYKDNEVL